MRQGMLRVERLRDRANTQHRLALMCPRAGKRKQNKVAAKAIQGTGGEVYPHLRSCEVSWVGGRHQNPYQCNTDTDTSCMHHAEW